MVKFIQPSNCYLLRGENQKGYGWSS